MVQNFRSFPVVFLNVWIEIGVGFGYVGERFGKDYLFVCEEDSSSTSIAVEKEKAAVTQLSDLQFSKLNRAEQ